MENSKNKKFDEVLFLISKGRFYWAVVLALGEGPRTGITMAEIKKTLVEFGVVKSLDQAWILIAPELEKMKLDKLAENQKNDTTRFKLTCAGRKTAKRMKEFAEKMNFLKQETETSQ